MKIRWFYKQFTVYMLFIDTLWRFFPLLFPSWPTVVRLRVRCVTVCWGRPRNELQLFSARERSAAATVTADLRALKAACAGRLSWVPKTCHTLTSSPAHPAASRLSLGASDGNVRTSIQNNAAKRLWNATFILQRRNLPHSIFFRHFTFASCNSRNSQVNYRFILMTDGELWIVRLWDTRCVCH